MLLTELQHFPLSEAFACLDCEAVGNRSQACAHCGSQSIFNIANVLDREGFEMAIKDGDARHQCICGHQRHEGRCNESFYWTTETCKCEHFIDASPATDDRDKSAGAIA